MLKLGPSTYVMMKGIKRKWNSIEHLYLTKIKGRDILLSKHIRCILKAYQQLKLIENGKNLFHTYVKVSWAESKF